MKTKMFTMVVFIFGLFVSYLWFRDGVNFMGTFTFIWDISYLFIIRKYVFSIKT